MAATCDVCSERAELIVVDLNEQEAECLCWACLAQRMLTTLAQAVEADDGDAASANSAPAAGR